MYLQRQAEEELRKGLSENKVVLVLGARQVGKTTLVREVLKAEHIEFLNFDVEIDKSRFSAAASLSPQEAMRFFGSPNVLVLDEAQRMPESARVVKGWFDSKVSTRILMLGSSSLNLLNQAAESLTGRNFKIILPPLLFSEAVRAQDWHRNDIPISLLCSHFAAPLHSFLLLRLAYGSYPEVILSSDPKRLLSELSADYLWKDVLQMGMIKTPDLIRRLLLLLAHQIGSEVSTNELSLALQISRSTIERYIDLLEQTFVLFRLPSYSTNPRKEISKSHKIYFWDIGIRNALIQAFSTNEHRPDIGAVFENWVIAEIAKRNVTAGKPYELFFWRSRSQSEVDLVMKGESGLRAFEIKWNPRRIKDAAFRSAYGVDVELLCPENPFVANIVDSPRS